MVNEDNKEHTSILWKVLNGEKPTEEEIKRDIEDYKRRQREQGLITFSEVLDKLGLDLYILILLVNYFLMMYTNIIL